MCPSSIEDSVSFSYMVNSRSPCGNSAFIDRNYIPDQKYKEIYGTNSCCYRLPLLQNCGHFMWFQISIRLIYDCCCTVLWTHGIIILRPRAFNLKSKYERQKPKNCLLALDNRCYVSTSLSLYPVDRAFS